MSISARRLSRRKRTPASTVNILSGKIFLSSVADSSTEPGNGVNNLTDENTSTRWISQPTSPVTIDVDMQGIYSLTRLTIVFAADTIRNYTASVSNDSTNWTVIASGVTNNTTSQTIDITSFSATPEGRYLRITGADRWNASYGNSIWEIEAYGPKIADVPIGTISGFAATAASDTSMSLSWLYGGSAVTNFTLKRGGTTIATLAAADRNYTDSPLSAGTSYTYTLTANLSAGGTSNTASSTASTTGGSGWPYDPNYTLLYEDTFAGTSLNTTYWAAETLPKGYRNNELQYYVPEQAIIGDNTLTIRAEKRGDGEWYSAHVVAKQSYHRIFGKYEAHMLIPQVKGGWPAFWLLPWGGAGWPGTGEVDIMEAVNAEGRAYMTLHHSGLQSGTGSEIAVTTLDMSQWHVYAVDVRNNNVRFYIDGALVGTATPGSIGGDWPFNSNAMGTILNLAVGGGWPGPPDGSTPNTFDLKIKNFRHYS